MQSKRNTNIKREIKVSRDLQDINGLEHFKKSIEKFFFADASIKLDSTKNNCDCHLILGLNCNFTLTESLFHLNSGNWGGFCKNTNQLEYSGFDLAVSDLQEINKINIIIEEIAIHFKDTSIFITKIPYQDITDQLCNILIAISENFVHFTKGLTEMPYEIFVPVFEEPKGADLNVSWVMSKVRTSYYNYWGLYFHSEINQDSLVYDLRSKSIIDGDFFLLNKE